MAFPIYDLHCDLLSFLDRIPRADPFDPQAIGCAVPCLQAGGVLFQVMAIYTDVEAGSMQAAIRQAALFQELLQRYPENFSFPKVNPVDPPDGRIQILAAIENAAGIGDEQASWPEIEAQLDRLLAKVGTLAYISLTHHTENRFGGGNYTKGVGLKADGKRLLELMDQRGIPVDLSHTSDQLAEGILNYRAVSNLKLPILASHANYRSIWDHPRNLPDEVAREIIVQKGIIGVNFLRAFLDNDVPERIFEHILHGFDLGGNYAQAFGADFFYTKDFPDPNRHPMYFPLLSDASAYPELLQTLQANLSGEDLECLAYRNVRSFYQNLLR